MCIRDRYSIYTSCSFEHGWCGEAVLPLAWRHRFLHFLRLPCTMEIPCRTISDRETSSVFAASSNFLTDSSSNRTRNITALGLFVGRPIFFCPLMLAPPFCSDIYIVANVATYVNRFKITWKTFTISYRAWCCLLYTSQGAGGADPAPGICQIPHRPALLLPPRLPGLSPDDPRPGRAPHPCLLYTSCTATGWTCVSTTMAPTWNTRKASCWTQAAPPPPC